MADQAQDPAALVNPLTGTATGGVFPGADTPFGMVQYSPNTDHPRGGGYNRSHPRTRGFATTHLSGPGCAAMGDVVSLPTSGPVTNVDVRRQRSGFSHSSERAEPGYYAVDLDDSKVHAELSATTHTGWARFTYPAGQGNVLVNPGADLRGARAADVHVRGSDTIEGSVSTWGYWNACPARSHNQYTLHFSMRFSRPFAAFGAGTGTHIRRGGRDATGPNSGAYASFDTAADARPVVAKVGISFVDLAGARRNLDAETGGSFDFDGVRAAARAAWNSVLGRVQVSGGSDDQRRTFYTALYHSLLHPNVFSDVDGRYLGFDSRVHRAAPGEPHYTSFSMWDTYRSEHQLIDLVTPERVPAMMRSLLSDARQSGWMPKWVFAHYFTNEMVGDPAANVVADAFGKGLVNPADARPLYRALVHNATDLPDRRRSPFEGRTGLQEYVNRGFVPYHAGGDYPKAGSINMEYGMNDCAVALMARGLGYGADWRYMARRSKRFRYSINRSSRFVRPRREDGSWLMPFNPRSGTGFKEGTAWQYTWAAPQDPSGLAGALGGRGRTLSKLDSFFAYDRLIARPAAARSIWRSPARHNPQNEVSLHAAYLYDYLGQPWKTQDVVRAAESLFSSAPNGLPSSDDLGALSSWYVLSALGIYPAIAGASDYALTSPLFEHAQLQLGGSGRPLVIDAPGAPAARYVSGVSLDGRALGTSAVSHGELAHGGTLSFQLQSTPDVNWAAGERAPGAACAANPRTADVRLFVTRARRVKGGAIVRTVVRNAGDGPARRLGLSLRVPAGWSATHRIAVLRYLAPGRSATRVWRLHGRGARHLRVDASWSGPGGRSGGALRTFATGAARAGR